MKRKPGIYLSGRARHDSCNFIHGESPNYEVPATVVVEFDLGGGYVRIMPVCDEHLAELHKVTAP